MAYDDATMRLGGGRDAYANRTGLQGDDRTRTLDGRLNTVYDDIPDADGDDRLMVHLVWEVLLAIVTAGVAVTLYRMHPDTLKGDALDAFLLTVTIVGLLAVGLGLSMRAAVPNLAVGPIAVAAGIMFAKQADRGFALGAGLVAAAVLVAGVAIAFVVVVLQVPAWAASLGAAFGVIAWIGTRSAVELPPEITYNPADHALIWFAAFLLISAVGGGLGLVPTVRRTLGAFRPVRDPAVRPSAGAGLAAFTAIVFSCLLAGFAGVLFALTAQGAQPTGSVELTGLALGAVLLGGTSAFGRRGGVLGTVLGVVLIMLVVTLGGEEGWKLEDFGYAGIAVGIGLLVTRLIETAGRPRPPMDEMEPEIWSGEEAAWRAPAPRDSQPWRAGESWRSGDPWKAGDSWPPTSPQSYPGVASQS